MSLKSYRLKPGDEAISPSHSYITTAAAVHFLGGVLVLAGCGLDQMLDPMSTLGKLEQHHNVKGIIRIQLNGRTCGMEQLLNTLQKGITYLLSKMVPQGLGSRFKGKHTGNFGLAGTFIFIRPNYLYV